LVDFVPGTQSEAKYSPWHQVVCSKENNINKQSYKVTDRTRDDTSALGKYEELPKSTKGVRKNEAR
jgi:hypothetical protein